jgi:hypothetical protein
MGPARPWRGAHRPLRKPLRRCRDAIAYDDFAPVVHAAHEIYGPSRFAPTGKPSTATAPGSPAATPSTRLGSFADLGSTEQQGGGTASADRRPVLCRVGSVIAPTVVAISRSPDDGRRRYAQIFWALERSHHRGSVSGIRGRGGLGMSVLSAAGPPWTTRDVELRGMDPFFAYRGRTSWAGTSAASCTCSSSGPWW